ncbi:hypothetical protein [Oligoflexus tunisiensis]|uniref:hypothetical protein n=1 Tax=Oligoflexus tunisiensis TaxID=708132 RepID=UPI00159F1DE3|nr:hypothetical protein [Oligoflexus tunisiensis]
MDRIAEHQARGNVVGELHGYSVQMKRTGQPFLSPIVVREAKTLALFAVKRLL